ncbi:EAL domain-containing protein [Paraburkholderia fungorum]|uniref:EAL domain-containing protein n=1 Tax=Paraburkholderia fungorum TaxID=134537 RepID=UPI0038BCF5B2
MSAQSELLRCPHRDGRRAHAKGWLPETKLPPVTAWYQPKTELATGKIVGVEALARIMDPVHGVSSPAAFLETASPVAIEELTYSILSQALAAQRDWTAAGYPLSVAVNVPASLIGRAAARDRLLRMVDECAATPQRIVLEIVETGTADDDATLPAATAELRAAGFGLAIDDFGIGHSSLLRLMQCPFTELKIDRAFVQRASIDPKVHAALDACVLLGKRLGMQITAEGVEKFADLEEVTAAGCDFVQGYLISRALPGELLPTLLSRTQPARGLLI